jgi:hypothetical protein
MMIIQGEDDDENDSTVYLVLPDSPNKTDQPAQTTASPISQAT